MSRYSDLVQAQGATHHWSFDEGSATFYDSVGGIHCDIVSGGSSEEVSVVKKGVKLEGSSLIRQSSLDSTLQFNPSLGFSYSVITRQDSYSSDNGIVCRRITSASGRTFAMFVFGTGSGGGLTTDIGGNQLRWSTDFYPTIGEWYHIAYTYDPADNYGRIYINGELEYSNEYSSSPTASSGDTYIMFGALQNSSGGSGSSNLNGAIDDTAIFEGKVLSQEEIRAQYNTAFPITRVFDGSTWSDADRRIL